MTAGAARQLDVLRDELAIPFRAGKLDGFKLIEHELEHPDGSKMLWYSADNPGLFEGQHSENLALFIDEAKSVTDDIALASNRLQANTTLVMSSPGAATGWFYNCFSSQKEFWRTAQIKAETVKRIPKDWIDEMRKMHRNHPDLLSSMLDAEFTSNDPNALIQLEWVNRCIKNPTRWIKGHLTAGIDLSASLTGDQSAIVVRDGNKIIAIVAWRDSDPMRVAGRCIVELNNYKVPKTNIFADSGGLGAGIVSRMQEIGWPVNGVQFGGSPLVKSDRIKNRMTELWDNMAEELANQRIILPDDPQLIAQLTGRKVIPTSSGQLRLETKAEMKKRGLDSPDIADALALSLMDTGKQKVTYTHQSHEAHSTMGNDDSEYASSSSGDFTLGNGM